MIVPRTCTEISAGEAVQRDKACKPLEDFRATPGYVLLGDPGSGKTTSFEAECAALGGQACGITARDFLAFEPRAHPEWLGRTLFIDGLDEVRAGSPDARTPFDRIRGRLDELGKPAFRLSCREADWLGADDRRRLESVSPDGKVTVLRLDPLTDEDVEIILEAHPDVGDAYAFISQAVQRGIGGLLTNPQTLDLLAKAVAGGDGRWPESRLQTFQMACEHMLRGPNDQPSAAKVTGIFPSPARLLDAAGRLCAIQLIAGKAGYTLHGQPNDAYPFFGSVGGASHSAEVIESVRTTRLFSGVSHNRFAPVHRHVAEFLGARYLSHVIEDGLPVRRVMALIAGMDGGVVTEMRGLSAWLAAHCKEARVELIERDPIGVGLYGDIRGFSQAEKYALLPSLRREGPRIEPWLDPRGDSSVDTFRGRVAAFGALATPDMESAFRNVLEDTNRDRDRQLFTDFVLGVLGQGQPMPGLAGIMLDIVRDETRLPRVNESALQAFMHNCSGTQRTEGLRRLLDGINSGELPDPNGRLLGILMRALYPDEMTPAEVWSIFSKQMNPEPIGRLSWLWDIVDESSDREVAELLDLLHQRLAELRPVLDVHHVEHLAFKLLLRGLKAHGDELDTARLYDWLGVCRPVGRSAQARYDVAAWLHERPGVQKALILEGLNRCPDSDDFESQVFRVYDGLHRAELPADFAHWCLDQAVAKARTKPRVAKHLFSQAFYKRNAHELPLDRLREHASKDEGLRVAYDHLVDRQSWMREQDLKHVQSMETYAEEERQREEAWLDHVRSQEKELYENRAQPGLLFQLAELYFGPPSSDDRAKAVWATIRADHRLSGVVLQAFRATVDRQDVPDLDDILSLRAKDSSHYLGLPFLAGLAEMDRAGWEDASRWDDCRMEKAIAFYYGSRHLLQDGQPQWYQRLLVTRPEAVAKVQARYAASELRSGRENVARLWDLEHDPAHARVARHASLPLLRAFPTRCKLELLRSLDNLLWAAISHADRSTLRELLDKKLSQSSMGAAQRVHWLAAGFAIDPEVYQGPLTEFVQDREKRVRQLGKFFCRRRDSSFGLAASREGFLARLVRLLGSHAGPERMRFVPEMTRESGWDMPGAAESRFVYDLLQILATSPAEDAAGELDALLNDPALARWRGLINQARESQRIIRRDSDYCHPEVEQVCRTLGGGKPANAADLAALLADRLDELAKHIRSGNTDDWRQYWNLDAYGRPRNPRPEVPCRNALLSDLRQRLPVGVDAQPEGHYANDPRADIRVSCGDFQVPVEVKRNSHRDLWSAMRSQLIARYASDPEAHGHGIYLVFWFGEAGGHRTPSPPPPAARPKSAAALKEGLERMLSSEDKCKISIRVIDVSKP
ncbi:MAG: hypothetical protein OXP66_18885 [Candidatus Tectomicrobia bacterium]|nr:hypothetical protein [Candidatus Tectomicrobia bacterium]